MHRPINRHYHFRVNDSFPKFKFGFTVVKYFTVIIQLLVVKQGSGYKPWSYFWFKPDPLLQLEVEEIQFWFEIRYHVVLAGMSHISPTFRTYSTTTTAVFFWSTWLVHSSQWFWAGDFKWRILHRFIIRLRADIFQIPTGCVFISAIPAETNLTAAIRYLFDRF